MAIALHVAGPCLITLADVPFGYTDNDEIPSYELTRHHQPVFSSDRGREPNGIVYQGATGVLNLLMSTWDLAALPPLLEGPGATAQGAITDTYEMRAGVIGTELYEAGTYFQTLVTPLKSGKQAYTFFKCWLDGGSVREFNFGNDGKKLGVQIFFMREDVDASNPPDGSSPTARLFTAVPVPAS